MFSAAVRSGWKPIPSSRNGVSFFRAVTLPEDGRRIFAIIFNKVLFPLPFSAWKVSYVGGLKTPVKVSNIVVLFSWGMRNVLWRFSTLIAVIRFPLQIWVLIWKK